MVSLGEARPHDGYRRRASIFPCQRYRDAHTVRLRLINKPTASVLLTPHPPFLPLILTLLPISRAVQYYLSRLSTLSCRCSGAAAKFHEEKITF